MLKFKIPLISLCIIMLSGCGHVAPEQLGISKDQWKHYSKQEQQRIINNHKYILKTVKTNAFATHGDSYLDVTIQNGKAVMSPFINRYAFKTATLKINDGACQAVTLYAVDSNKHTVLYVCYNSDVLLLDPSLYEIDKRYGSVRIHDSLLWNDGFSYTGINTDGYAHLQNATIFVKKYNEKNKS